MTISSTSALLEVHSACREASALPRAASALLTSAESAEAVASAEACASASARSNRAFCRKLSSSRAAMRVAASASAVGRVGIERKLEDGCGLSPRGFIYLQ